MGVCWVRQPQKNQNNLLFIKSSADAIVFIVSVVFL